MGQVCRVCNLDREDRLEVERQLLQGKNKSEISRRYGVSVDSLTYHFKHHISGQMREAWRRVAEKEGVDVLGELDSLVQRSRRILTEAEEQGHKRLELSAVKELRNTLELISRIAFAIEEKEAKATIIEVQQDQEYGELIREALGTLTPLERHIHRQLNLKMISGITDTRIPGIDYSWEGRLDGEGEDPGQGS